MSDETVVVASPSMGGSPGDLTAGMLLRQAREATGLHIAALAVSMKVPVKKLEALEADRLEELPDAVFIRALAASVCRTLKVDPAPVLSKLPQSVAPRLDKSERGVSLPARSSGFLAGHSMWAFALRPTVLVVAALLLAALAVALFPEARNSVGLAELAKPVAVATVAVPLAKELIVVGAPVVSEASVPALPSTQASLPAPAAVLPLPPSALAASAAGGAQAPPASAGVSPDASVATNGLLVFKAKSRAWVRVSDSKGVVQFEKTLAAGESAAATGTLPLAVIVGNVAATEVVLRGQPFSLDAVNQNNVARFEVK
jgi:cytoskeleton protein RodZ